MNLHDWLCTVISDDEDVLLANKLDEAVIGVTQDSPPRAVYDADKVISLLVRDGMPYEDAQEFFDFNIAGSHVGPGTPIWIHRFPEA